MLTHEEGTLPMETKNDAIINPDFLALGLGGTNMMSMLWTVAMGRQAVGVEMRGDPFLGVHWNIREDFYHQLGLIDQMMLERYGAAASSGRWTDISPRGVFLQPT